MTEWRTVGPVSATTRLNRIFDQSADTYGDVPFIWHVQTQFPFFVGTGNKVYIRSSITEEFP